MSSTPSYRTTLFKVERFCESFNVIVKVTEVALITSSVMTTEGSELCLRPTVIVFSPAKITSLIVVPSIYLMASIVYSLTPLSVPVFTFKIRFSESEPSWN